MGNSEFTREFRLTQSLGSLYQGWAGTWINALLHLTNLQGLAVAALE